MNEQIKYGDTKERKSESGRTMRDLVSWYNLLIQHRCIMLCYTSILFLRRMNARLEGCMERTYLRPLDGYYYTFLFLHICHLSYPRTLFCYLFSSVGAGARELDG